MIKLSKIFSIVAASVSLFAASAAYANVVIPNILGSNMVLQRGRIVPVWGTASPGEKVKVKFNNQIRYATADASGNWKVRLNPMMENAKPQSLTITGNNTIELTSVLIGEVWICSGQSNMQYEMRKNSKVKKPDTSTVNSPVDELDRAHNPVIRIFMTTQKNLLKPDTTYSKGWAIAQDSALRAFSAAGYFFGKELNAQLKVPVGIICSSVSGSRIEPWIPEDAFAKEFYFKDKKVDGDPGKFYTKMIEPLAPFAIKGFLWYQGESNCFLAENISYTYKMKVLIDSWRKLWDDKTLPFYYVQLAPYIYSKAVDKFPKTEQTLPGIREAQVAALAIPYTGMIVTTDLNDDVKNIHPPFKWEIGRRLALVALAKSYNKTNLVYSGPAYKQMKINGNKAELEFTSTGNGLENHDGKPLTDFIIAGADGRFVPATAVIAGDKVIVSSPEVAKPVAVRFAWSETAQPNFFNKDGLPAVPFRTDDPLKFTAK